MPTLAAVFAHPDDETFAVGGVIAKYAESGASCHLYSATDGDAGRSSGVVVSSREELAKLRRAELHKAASVLGISTVRMGGHPDGSLLQVDYDQLVGEIVDFLREHRPQVVLTFGPEGAPTGHRDHKAISRAATAAFFLSGLRTSLAVPQSGAAAHDEPFAPSRLYYVSWDPPPATAEFQTLAVPLTARVDIRTQLGVKREAFLAHTTQRDHAKRFEELGLTNDECFALAAGVPQPAPITDDLFAGL